MCAYSHPDLVQLSPGGPGINQYITRAMASIKFMLMLSILSLKALDGPTCYPLFPRKLILVLPSSSCCINPIFVLRSSYNVALP